MLPWHILPWEWGPPCIYVFPIKTLEGPRDGKSGIYGKSMANISLTFDIQPVLIAQDTLYTQHSRTCAKNHLFFPFLGLLLHACSFNFNLTSVRHPRTTAQEMHLVHAGSYLVFSISFVAQLDQTRPDQTPPFSIVKSYFSVLFFSLC